MWILKPERLKDSSKKKQNCKYKLKSMEIVNSKNHLHLYSFFYFSFGYPPERYNDKEIACYFFNKNGVTHLLKRLTV